MGQIKIIIQRSKQVKNQSLYLTQDKKHFTNKERDKFS